jgi:ribosomal protein S18 acetylase RimI-like enzyme
MRVIVDPPARGKGLGQKLTQECFAIALEWGIEKMTAQMTVDQRGAIALFEGMGFRAEALLANQVRDGAGKKHDVVVLSHDVATAYA